MKVLVVSHVDNFSGANKSMFSIINELEDKINFTLLTNGDAEKFNNVISSKVKVISTQYGWWYAKSRKNILKRIYRFTADTFNYYSKKNIDEELINLLRNEKFDLVYTNTSVIDMGIKISRILNIPHVWHVREFGKEDFGFIPVVSKRYINKCFNESNAIITISQALYNKYQHVVDKEKLHLVYNGFDIDKLNCNPKKHDFNQGINILIAGQVTEAKGQEQAIAAVEKLNNLGYSVRLFVAGDINKEYLSPIISKYGDPEWLKVLGKVDNMYELRNEIDIELICSRCEAFGRVTIEAMLHGLPVVGANSGGTSELIENGVTGMLYELQNIEDLVKKIQFIIDNPSVYNKIIINAHKFAKRFTVSNTAKQIYNIFKTVLIESGGENEKKIECEI